MTNIYSKEFIVLINAWQATGNNRVGADLKKQAEGIDAKYKTCDGKCYRKYGFQKGPIYSLHTKLIIPEKISSWTLDKNVAKEFKDGIPEKESGYYGLILAISPEPKQVIINLTTLYSDPIFLEACEKYKGAIFNGIGIYGNTQKEIVLEIPEVSVNEIFAYGGHNTDLRILVEFLYGKVTDECYEQIISFLPPHKITGKGWLEGAGKDRVVAKMIAAGKILESRKMN